MEERDMPVSISVAEFDFRRGMHVPRHRRGYNLTIARIRRDC